MISFSIRKTTAICLWTLALALASAAQTPPKMPGTQDDDVVRVNTELVQTDVMVFDKKGRFVDGLKADQFELKIDDKSQTISFLSALPRALSVALPALANRIRSPPIQTT